jgi:hypothetical protein
MKPPEQPERERSPHAANDGAGDCGSFLDRHLMKMGRNKNRGGTCDRAGAPSLPPPPRQQTDHNAERHSERIEECMNQ